MNNVKRYVRLVAVICATLVSWSSLVGAESEQPKSLDVEQREVDELIERMDSVELRKVSPRIFRLAERLLKERGSVEAKRYIEKGLEANPWALQEQLALGEILLQNGQRDALRERAEMVLRVGEDDDVLKRASLILGRALPEKPVPLSQVQETDTMLVLVPVGSGNSFALQDLRDELSKRLGIEVRIASLDMKPLKADRTARARWVAQTRAQVLRAVEGQPGLATQLRRIGFEMEQLATKDDVLVAMIRKTTEMEQGAAKLQELDAMLAQLDSTAQYDVANVIPALEAAVAGRAGPRLLVLGVTPYDLFGSTSNFLFGAASPGSFLGVVSMARFQATFNDEAPQRERLKARLLKQSLSTIGFMLGVQRCNTPECARAYPQSIAEHDQKPSTLCSACRAAFDAALNRQLPRE